MRYERAELRVADGVEIEGPRTLIQVVNYSENGLLRETLLYRGGAVHQKTVQTYLPDGNREGTSVFNGDGKLISKVGYEYDSQGLLVSEVLYLGDGSVKERKTIEASDTPRRRIAITRTIGTGATAETSINTIESLSPIGSPRPEKRSIWATTKADGIRTEDSYEVDASGTHNDQQLRYSADGSLTGKRVSIVDAGVNRLEATEYDAAGNIKNRTLETREYDSHRNLIQITGYKWNSTQQKFEPFVVSYHIIEYYQ